MWDPPTNEDRPRYTDVCGYRPMTPPLLMLAGQTALILFSPWSFWRTIGLMFVWLVFCAWLTGVMRQRHFRVKHKGAHTIAHVSGNTYSRDPYAHREA